MKISLIFFLFLFLFNVNGLRCLVGTTLAGSGVEILECTLDTCWGTRTTNSETYGCSSMSRCETSKSVNIAAGYDHVCCQTNECNRNFDSTPVTVNTNDTPTPTPLSSNTLKNPILLQILFIFFYFIIKFTQ